MPHNSHIELMKSAVCLLEFRIMAWNVGLLAFSFAININYSLFAGFTFDVVLDVFYLTVFNLDNSAFSET